MLGWALLWLAGTAAVAGYSITRHVPALERVMREDVQEAIAPLAASVDAAAVSVSVRDHVATLSGTVAGDAERDALIAAAGDGFGIRGVVDRLVLREPEPELAPPSASPEPPSEPPPAPDRPSADARVERLADEMAAATTAMPEGGTDGSSDGDDPSSGDAFETAEATSEPPDGTAVGTADASPPALRIDVVDRVLTIEGSLSRDDDAAALVLMAMDSFELDYVSNTLESGSNVPSAPWLAALGELLPALASLDDPGVDVADDRVTLYGTAPDAATRDAIVTRARANLEGYSLIERIGIADPMGTGGVSAPSSDAGPDGVMADGVAGEGSIDPDAGADGPEGTDPDAVTDAAAPGATADSDAAELDGVDSVEPDSAEPGASASDADATDVDAEAAGDGAAVPDEDAANAGASGGETDAADANAVAPDGDDTDPIDDPDTTDLDPADTDAADTDATAADAAEAEPSDAGPTRTALLDSGGDASDPTPASRPEPASSTAALRAALDALPNTRILFEFASATLTGPSGDVVDAIAETLLAHPGVPIAIEGHTDGIGFRERNLELSQRRANAVRDRLVERGVPFERLTSYGYGEGVPVADNASPEGRAANRRIEFTF